MTDPRPLLVHGNLIGGKYRLGPVIGVGGVGTVYRASHLWTEREVAVKVLDPTLPHFDLLRAAFLREARTAVQLRHANVVDILDMGEDGRTTYLVMELLHGPTLRDVLLERGRLSPEDTLDILLPLIDALDKAHQLGIVHRDFKPENIILSFDSGDVMTPKLLDFGVAQILREVRLQGLASPNDIIVGTPQYMSPEQARDERTLIGPHTDVWGVGVVWYECLTGHSPFDGDSPLEILTSVCEAPIDFEGVPEVYAPLLTQALTRSPELRIQTLSELKARISETRIAEHSTKPATASLSSWSSSRARESYVRQTLQGLGTKGISSVRSRSLRLDSELLTPPSKTPRMVAVGGIALSVAVALAAWWTVRGAREKPVIPVEPVISETQALLDEGESSTPTALATPIPADDGSRSIPSASGPESPRQDPPAEDGSAGPKSKASAPVRPKRRGTAAPDERRPSSPSTTSKYQEPPDLVTEW
jgi:serine/threonine protein kinase